MRNAFGQPQSVLVLGGTSEIALSVVERLVAARTQTVVLAGRNPSGLDLAAQELRDKGAQSVETLVFDADEPSNAQAVIDQAFEKAGGSIDLVLIAVGQLGDQDRHGHGGDGGLARRQLHPPGGGSLHPQPGTNAIKRFASIIY